jgi:S1-C subfamily serine protease
MEAFSSEVLHNLRRAMVIFTAAHVNKKTSWSSGFACFPDQRVIITCSHNFIEAIPSSVVARQPTSDARCGVPRVIFSKKLDCALAILERPLATYVPWADSLQVQSDVVVPDYVTGDDRFSTAWKGELSDRHLVGQVTSTILKSSVWVGGNYTDTRQFSVSNIHPGLSGSPILDREGMIVGQVAESHNTEGFISTGSHLLEELRGEALGLYEKARVEGILS